MTSLPRDDNRVPIIGGASDVDGRTVVPIYADPDTRELYVRSGIDNTPLIQHAINEIFSTYGDTVSVGQKAKSLLKFGRNPNVGTSASTLWFTGQDQANETYAAANTNPIDSISSSASGDTSLEFVIEGHTESGDNKTFVSQTVALNASDGQTRAALGTPLNRATRAYNNGSTAASGEIYIYQNTPLTSGKPTDTTKIHITVAAGKNQSEKASTSLSSQDYWIITNFYAGYIEKTGSNTADVELTVRFNGKLFRPRADLVVSTGSHEKQDFYPALIVPPNSDIRLEATSSTTSQQIEGGIDGFLALVI